MPKDGFDHLDSGAKALQPGCTVLLISCNLHAVTGPLFISAAAYRSIASPLQPPSPLPFAEYVIADTRQCVDQLHGLDDSGMMRASPDLERSPGIRISLP